MPQKDSYLNVLGNTPRKSKLDPDLARQMNEEYERQERLEELKRKLEGKKTKEEQEVQEEQQTQPIIMPSQFTPEDYILLEGKTHGTYNYPDLFVSMYRLGTNPEVEKAAQKLGYSIQNTAKEQNSREYIGNINWEQALKLNLSLGRSTFNPRQFADFLQLLKSGKAFDGTGKKIPKSKLTEILNEITEIREPWRSEWLDADFKYSNDKLWLYSDHRLANGNLEANYKKELEDCLMTKESKINLQTINAQGMPIKEGNDFYYWCPDKDNKSVARFLAGSGGASLYCGRYPGDAYSSLGVRCIVTTSDSSSAFAGGN